MSATCGSADPDSWVRSLFAVADCQAALLGADGWQGLSSSTLFAVMLSGLLTLAVARLGYRLMRGNVHPTEAVTLSLHIGIVIALATSWQAYDRVIYRVAMNGPAEIAAEIFPAAGIDATYLSERLQNAYDAISISPTLSDSNSQKAGDIPSSENAAPAESQQLADRKRSAGLMIASGAGTWIAARISLALLLALGPFAFAASLFPFSAGLLIGWLRAVLGTALATLVIPLALTLELQMLDAPVRAALRAGSAEIAGLDAIVWSFVLVIAALIFAVQRFAGGLTMPLHNMRPWLAVNERTSAPSMTTSASSASPSAGSSTARYLGVTVATHPSRAMGIVRAVETRERSLRAAGPTLPPSAATAQTAGSNGRTSIRRGSQIVDGARRSGGGRPSLLSKRPEALS
ncbi:type IV secretion system protein [Sphingobium sp. MK2]|uniref:type IV secretion system protein n=1 Tax=Sphingobium sp. MK2 TaxID=3116540 RepID=UPI0032E360DA